MRAVHPSLLVRSPTSTWRRAGEGPAAAEGHEDQEEAGAGDGAGAAVEGPAVGMGVVDDDKQRAEKGAGPRGPGQGAGGEAAGEGEGGVDGQPHQIDEPHEAPVFGDDEGVRVLRDDLQHGQALPPGERGAPGGPEVQAPCHGGPGGGGGDGGPWRRTGRAERGELRACGKGGHGVPGSLPICKFSH